MRLRLRRVPERGDLPHQVSGLTIAQARYLAAIGDIAREGEGVRSAEVARRLGVTRASVARMLRVLTERGWTRKTPYGRIELTQAGEPAAALCRERMERLDGLMEDLSALEALGG
jgi:DtxR family Mn-dependent transcriptional regulator